MKYSKRKDKGGIRGVLIKSTSTLREANLQSTIQLCINLHAIIGRLIKLETDDLLFHCKKNYFTSVL